MNGQFRTYEIFESSAPVGLGLGRRSDWCRHCRPRFVLGAAGARPDAAARPQVKQTIAYFAVWPRAVGSRHLDSGERMEPFRRLRPTHGVVVLPVGTAPTGAGAS